MIELADRQKELHPADELHVWLVMRITDGVRIPLAKLKEKLHELYDTAYKLGYEQGQEDEHGESRKPL